MKHVLNFLAITGLSSQCARASQVPNDQTSNIVELARPSILSQVVRLSDTYNLFDTDIMTNQIGYQVSQFLPQYLPDSPVATRLSSHIFTDKEIYRPNDMVFVEVLVLDAFNKTPVSLDPQVQYDYRYYISMQVSDPMDEPIFQSYNYIQNSTATFTYKIPINAVGGDYLIKIQNSYSVAPTTKIIRVRDYSRNQLSVKVSLIQSTFTPGETVIGQIKLDTLDGTAFQTIPSYAYSVSFDSQDSTWNTTNQTLLSFANVSTSNKGASIFSFVIPANTTTSVTTIAFIYTYGSVNQVYSVPLIITMPINMVLDFYTENFGPLVVNCTNKITFMAYTNKNRVDYFSFSNATLFGIDANGTIFQLSNSSISTLHRGQGQLQFIYSANLTVVYLNVQTATNQTLTFPVVPTNPKNNNTELVFTVLNPNRVIPGYGDAQAPVVNVKFQTNNLVNKTDRYLLQLKCKEQVVSQQQLTLQKNQSSYEISINAGATIFPNGGILSLNLYRLSSSVEAFFGANMSNSSSFKDLTPEIE